MFLYPLQQDIKGYADNETIVSNFQLYFGLSLKFRECTTDTTLLNDYH